MTPTDKNFEEVLELFEKNGWKLHRIQGCNRVFTKVGENPCVIPVRNQKVEVVYVKEIEQFFSEKQRASRCPK